MNKDTLKKVIIVFAGVIAVIGIVSLIVCSDKITALLGLLIGAVSVIINYALLHKLMKFVATDCPFCAVQTYVVRLFIYLLAIIAVTQRGSASVCTFAAAVIGLTVAIVVVYGTGGRFQDLTKIKNIHKAQE